MKPAILALLSILLLSSCSTTGKMAGVRPGMSKAEVVTVAGDPDGYQKSGDYEALFYVDRKAARSWFGGTYRDVVDYSIILKEDHVVEFGPGRTHQREGEVPFVRVPMR
jgi:outer membrane protein assembly factor BamE (lipoprotein component of BamABCDE complex)